MGGSGGETNVFPPAWSTTSFAPCRRVLQMHQAEQLQPAATSWVWWLRSPVVTVSPDTFI